MKTRTFFNTIKTLAVAATLSIGSLAAFSQGPGQPPPGAPGTLVGGGMNPMVGNAIGGPGPVVSNGTSLPGPGAPAPAPQPAPQPTPPPAWGSPWWNGWNPSPTVVISPSVSVSNLNSGRMKVIACGYDASGVWRVVPLYVSYNYNGINYNVNVLNAWNPWTDLWNTGVDVQAFSTDYTLRGINYNYYVVLPYGTFYFNL